MGASKNNPTAITMNGKGRFPDEIIADCENSLCVEWAVAFERITGWPVHLIHIAKTPLRAYCEDDGRWCYDVRGMMSPLRHGDIVKPLVNPDDWPDSAFIDGAERTRLKIGMACVGADRLEEYGIGADERRVEQCEAWIRNNATYLSLVPTRPKPWATARDIARYSFGGCVVYAEALARITGLPAVTMTAVGTTPGIQLRGGGFHGAVQHPDGTLEDIWGRFPVERVAARYGMLDWEISQAPHDQMVADALRTRPEAKSDIETAVAVAEALRRR